MRVILDEESKNTKYVLNVGYKTVNLNETGELKP